MISPSDPPATPTGLNDPSSGAGPPSAFWLGTTSQSPKSPRPSMTKRWKAASFLEGSYQRCLAGRTHDTYFAKLDGGVVALGQRALRQTQA
jgi:hypothetical protein